jgi:hypothetical protein
MDNVIIPIEQEKLQKIEGHSTSIEERVAQLSINTHEEFEAAKQLYLMVVASEKKGKAWVKGIVGPFKEAIKNAESQIKPLLRPYSDAKTTLKMKLEVYVAQVGEQKRLEAEAERKARYEENAKREEAARIETERLRAENPEAAPVVADLVAPAPVQIPDHSTKTASGSVGTRKVWSYKIKDFAKVSDEFKIENSKAIMQAQKQGLQIEGVEFYQKEIMAARTA